MAKKQLVNLAEHQKGWMLKVIEVAKSQNMDTNQTDVLRTIFDIVMNDDPESFVARMSVVRLQSRKAEIARRRAELDKEAQELDEELTVTSGRATAAAH